MLTARFLLWHITKKPNYRKQIYKFKTVINGLVYRLNIVGIEDLLLKVGAEVQINIHSFGEKKPRNYEIEIYGDKITDFEVVYTSIGIPDKEFFSKYGLGKEKKFKKVSA